MTGLRILVLGASGFIGPAVVRRAIARGHHPIAASRNPRAADVAGESVRLDRNDVQAVSACLRSARPDAVVDLIAYTSHETLPLLARLAGNISRYVMASSGDVYLQYDLLHRRDVGSPLATLREDAPLRKRLHPYRTDPPRASDDADAWMDDYDKIPIERSLASMHDLSWSVVRLPMVYGPGDRNRRLDWAIQPMASGTPVLKLDGQWANWRTSLGYVDDVADALVLAAAHAGAHARTFNAGPAEAMSNLQWARKLSGIVGWQGELQTVLREETPEPMRSQLAGLDLSVPVVLDTGSIRLTLGYSEVVTLEEALAATVGAESALAAKRT